MRRCSPPPSPQVTATPQGPAPSRASDVGLSPRGGAVAAFDARNDTEYARLIEPLPGALQELLNLRREMGRPFGFLRPTCIEVVEKKTFSWAAGGFLPNPRFNDLCKQFEQNALGLDLRGVEIELDGRPIKLLQKVQNARDSWPLSVHKARHEKNNRQLFASISRHTTMHISVWYVGPGRPEVDDAFVTPILQFESSHAIDVALCHESKSAHYTLLMRCLRFGRGETIRVFRLSLPLEVSGPFAR